MNKILLISLAFFYLISCSEKEKIKPESGITNPNGNSGNLPAAEWLIPKNEVFDGGPGKDGIPALENPEFISLDKATYLNNNDLVLGFRSGNAIKAYPHKILDWHEIINDNAGSTFLAVTYCPLTGTGVGWNRLIDGNKATFGVSGLLYNSNLIPYDRATGSNWSQMRMDCVNGPLQGKNISTYHLIETNWGTWKQMFPNSVVASSNTTYERNYNRYPYGDYRSDHDIFLFPVHPQDARLPAKERVYGIITPNKVKAYRFSNFDNQEVQLFQDKAGKVPVVIIGSKKHEFIVAYQSRTKNLEDLEFTVVEGDDVLINGALVSDQYGNVWDIFGHAISGPHKGAKLLEVKGFVGFWFAWGAFYPDLEVQL